MVTRARGLAGVLPPAGQRLDFTELRTLEGLRRSQGLISIGLVAAAALAIRAFMGVPLLLPWLGGMLASVCLHSLAVRSLPDTGARRRLLLPVFTLLFSGLVYIAGGMILWVQDEPGLTVLSLLFIFVALLNTLTYRVQMRMLLVLDLALMGIGILARAGWLWYAAPGSADTVLVSAALVICYLFFCRVAWGVLRTREALETATSDALVAARGRAMEQLTGGVAHDFNNLLTAVLGNVELARLTPTPGERDVLLDEAERAARRGAELTGQLLAMASCARLKPASMSPDALTEVLYKRARDLLGPAHEMRVEVAPNLPQVRVDGAQLQGCLLELISNARDAMPEGGTIELRVYAELRGGSPSVCFEVRDHGTGIPPDLMPLVCEPYFTTKPVGEGSGLGLAMLRGFAEQSGGAFELAAPVPGPGTLARLYLPLAREPQEPAPGPAADAPVYKAAKAVSAAD